MDIKYTDKPITPFGGLTIIEKFYQRRLMDLCLASGIAVEIEKRVEKILALKKKNPDADVSALEAEIDQLVYKLYDLTESEIAIVGKVA